MYNVHIACDNLTSQFSTVYHMAQFLKGTHLFVSRKKIRWRIIFNHTLNLNGFSAVFEWIESVHIHIYGRQRQFYDFAWEV